MRQALFLAVLLALIAASTADAATPAQYKARVNGICRSYTVKFKRIEATMAKEQKAGNTNAYALALGTFLGTGLQQDAKVEAVPVPVAIRAQMKPILTLLKQVDGYVRAALAGAAKNDAVSMTVELTKVNNVAGKLNKKFDAAGLRDCGSNQK